MLYISPAVELKRTLPVDAHLMALKGIPYRVDELP